MAKVELFETARKMVQFAEMYAGHEDIGKWKVSEVLAMMDDFYGVLGLNWKIEVCDVEK